MTFILLIPKSLNSSSELANMESVAGASGLGDLFFQRPNRDFYHCEEVALYKGRRTDWQSREAEPPIDVFVEVVCDPS